jgi:hypothetical protein
LHGRAYDRGVPLLISDDAAARRVLQGTAIGAALTETIAC